MSRAARKRSAAAPGGTNHARLAGARLLHTMTVARSLPGFAPSNRLLRATDETIEYIGHRHPNTRTAREWGFQEAAE